MLKIKEIENILKQESNLTYKKAFDIVWNLYCRSPYRNVDTYLKLDNIINRGNVTIIK